VPELSLEARIDFLAAELEAYQDRAYADRFRGILARVRAADEKAGQPGDTLTRTVAENLFKVMAYKDEYEVARLYSRPEFREALLSTFAAPKTLKVMLAPPLLSRTDPATGRPKKRAFGPWVFKAFGLLARMKGLRGTHFDPFGRTAERRAERALIDTYVGDIERILAALGTSRYDLLLELARYPDRIRGFGPIKDANREKTMEEREEQLARLATPPGKDTAPVRQTLIAAE
jgi:indolepyruvate ferredoxin oxidoreductase